jgi:hypothetical protein
MLTKKNIIIFTIILLIIIFLYYVSNYDENYENCKNNNNLMLKHYNRLLEQNSLIPSRLILSNDKLLINSDNYSKYKFDKKIEKDMSKLRWFEQEVKNKNLEVNKKICLNNLMIIFNCYFKIVNKVDYYIIFSKKILEELNDRITFYYRFINLNGLFDMNYNNKKIKVFKVAKHNHAVEWIYRNIKDDIGTILHVDTHADMNPVNNDFKFVKKCIDNKDFSFNNLKRIFNSVQDIGSVLVPMVAPYKVNKGIIWVTPDWVKEPFCKSENIITTTKNSCAFVGECPKIFPLNKIDGLYKDYFAELKQINFNEEDKKINVITSNIKFKDKIIENISEDYILNIDLDYFVTFGEESYLPIGMDAISDNRTIFDYGFILKSESSLLETVKKIEIEMNLIRKRIDDFLNLIITLKNLGKIPKIIIICDSTSVNFTNDQLSQEFMTKNKDELTNEFTPKYLTFWLHNTIHRHLEIIFKN